MPILQNAERNPIRRKLNGDIACSCIRGFNIVKMLIFPKLIYRFKTISIKISAGFL